MQYLWAISFFIPEEVWILDKRHFVLKLNVFLSG